MEPPIRGRIRISYGSVYGPDTEHIYGSVYRVCDGASGDKLEENMERGLLILEAPGGPEIPHYIRMREAFQDLDFFFATLEDLILRYGPV